MKNTTGDLRNKEVINVCDGARLGYIVDVIFDTCDGKISAIVVPGADCGLFCISKKNDITVPWCAIEKIGEDTILVRLPEAEICCPEPKKKKGVF